MFPKSRYSPCQANQDTQALTLHPTTALLPKRVFVRRCRDLGIEKIREYLPALLHYDAVCVFDDQHEQYVVRKLGWKEGRRIRQTVLHVALRNRKIWIEEDWTEDGIATYFLKDGVPADDMVLGFQPPIMRPYTEFAVA